jgi:hypothetical protein
MSQYTIYDISPGETATLTFNVSGLLSGEDISNATLEIRKRSGIVILPLKTITIVETDNGIIQEGSSGVDLIFQLTPEETWVLDPAEPYYLFSVNITTSLGRKQAIVPIGRLSPSLQYPFVPSVRLGSVAFSVKLTSVDLDGVVVKAGSEIDSVCEIDALVHATKT